jgi:WD40 repeat protein
MPCFPNAPQSLLVGVACVIAWSSPVASQEKLAEPHVIATFRGHTDAVYAVALTRDGAHLATGSFDNTVKLWDTETARAVRTFAGPEGHKSMVLCVAFNDDGTLLASGGADKSLKVWECNAANKKPRSFPHPDHVDAVAFQPGGSLLASGCHDGKIRFFDLGKSAAVKEIVAHAPAKANMIYTLAFTPDGKQLVSGSFDQSLKLWDVASGKQVREFRAYAVKDFEQGHRDAVFAAALSPDGKLLASGSAGQERAIKIWKVADGALLRELTNPKLNAKPPAAHPGWVYNLRFTSDGKHLVSVGDAPQNHGFLAVWDPADGRLLYDARLPLGNFFALAISPDGQALAVGAGTRGRPNLDLNNAYLLRMPRLPD